MHHHLSLRAKIIVMLSVMAAMLLVALDQTIIATALTSIVEQFNAYDSLAWIVTAYLLTTTITVPIAGKLSDLFGRRIMLLVGVGIFTVGSFMSGTSGNITDLILCRGLQGVGGGIITANAFTIIGDLFAARERGRWQGLMGAVFGFSSVIGPLLGGWLTDGQHIFNLVTNWRWTLLLNVPIGIAAFIIVAVFCPPLKHDNKPKVDYIGAILLSLFLGLLIVGIDNTSSIFSGFMTWSGWSLTTLRVVLFTVCAALLAGFIWAESRAREPIIPLSFFKNRTFVLIMTIATLFGGAFMGAILYLTQFNQQVFGATPTQSGLMLLPMVGGIMLSSIGSGQLISRIGRYKIFMQIGFAVATIAMFFMAMLTPTSGYMYEAIVMVALGLGLGVAMPVMTLAVQNEFSVQDLGAATSSSQLFRSLGSTLGTAIFGAILTAGIISGLGNVQNMAYLKTLSHDPQAAKIGSFTDANTLLTLNTPAVKKEITNGADAAFAKLPAEVAAPAKKQFDSEQADFSNKVVNAFSDSLQRIFLTSAFIILIVNFLVLALKEHPLKSAKATDTPGEEAEA